ncbi:MAG: hypothetical protein J6S22_03230 [Clostridia bacterium]|nr:hypothetical protein [Clostridia bacterium]
MKYAVIDIGSNSVRLLIQSDGKTLYKGLNSTRLGEGIAFSSRLLPAAMERTALAIKEFKEKALALGVDEVYAFATAAVRSALNRAEFLSTVKRLTGMEIDVLSGEAEASVGLTGALGNADGGIIDIGGGSTEFTMRINNAVTYSKSIDLGAVRLYDLCGRDKELLNQTIQNNIIQFKKVNCAVPVYGIGGTATSLAALALGLKTYDGHKVQDFVLQKTQLQTLSDTLFETSVEELMEISCLTPSRAQIIAGGALLLLRLMEYFQLSAITISEKDNLEGYLIQRGLQ